MNRRGFISAMSALVAAPALVSVRPPPVVEYAVNTTPPMPVKRADGSRYIVGRAMESVSAGDFVQIQTCGQATVTIQPVRMEAICSR